MTPFGRHPIRHFGIGTEMRCYRLLASVLVLGVVVWLSSRVEDSQHMDAAITVLAVLIFSAAVAQSRRIY